MIRQVKGTVLEMLPTGAVVDVGGWGVFVYLPIGTLYTLGEMVTLKTYLSVTQNGMELFGFADALDRTFFEHLLTVPSIGPKTALSILSRAPRASLEGAIASRDISYLTRVAGLGKKAAEKLVVELSEKITPQGAAHDTIDTEVFDTLVALGYTEREARQALARVPLHVSGRDARLKAALSSS